MSQVIKIKRGGISGLSGLTTAQGELIIVTGSAGSVNGPILLAHGDSLGLVAGAVFTGSTAPTITDPQLNGILFFDTDDNKFYRLDAAGNQELNPSIPFSAADISGSFTLTSASIATDIATNVVNISNNAGAISTLQGNPVFSAADISGSFVATSASIASDIAAINNYTAADISGAFVATSASIATDIAINVVNISNNAGAISTLQGNPVFSATDISGSFTLTSASIASDIASLESTNFTAADISGSSTAPIAAAVAGLASTSDLDGLVSASNGADNRVAVFTGPDGIEGDTNLTWDGTTFTVTGDLSVSGTTTTVNSTEVNIGDRILTLNSANSSGDGGIYVNDADSPFSTGSLLYKSTAGYWTIGSVGGTENRIVEFDSVSAQVNGFIHLNGDREVVSVAQGDAGSILMSDGDNTFTVTNVIDGGTF